MNVVLVAVGDRMPAWVQSGFDEYAKRLPRELRLSVRQIKAGPRTKGADLARLVREEGERVWAAVPKGAYVVALDREGQELDTQGISVALKAQMARGSDIAFLIGGPEGLSAECLARAHARWSLSRLTLAHPVVRVVFAEQLYRAWSILNNLPYHR